MLAKYKEIYIISIKFHKKLEKKKVKPIYLFLMLVSFFFLPNIISLVPLLSLFIIISKKGSLLKNGGKF